MKRYAIFGGTFNPVHKEHVALARVAVKELCLDGLIVMPTYQPPHKTNKPAPAEDRLNMLRLAFSGEDEVTVSDFEILKQGKSYTYQTVEHFKKQLDCELYFIVGGDMLKDFKTWRYPERILNACTLACFGREDFGCDYDKEGEYFEKTFNKKFVRLSYQGGKDSSTRIRVYNSFGLDIKEMVGEKVADYIREKGLYLGDEYTKIVKKALPEKRLIHTANVVVCALYKAKQLDLDEQKVKLATTLHDVAKYIDYKKVEGFTVDSDVPQPVIHSFLGAHIAEKQLNGTDQEVLDAIRYHTSGKAEMSTLSKLVFVADMIEDGRDYLGVDTLRDLYYNGDFNQCFIECLKEETIHLINKKEYIYKKTLEAYDYYVKDKKGEI